MTNLTQVAFFLKDKGRASTLYDLLLPYAERTVIVGSANDCFGVVARYLGLLATILERWDKAMHHFEAALAINTQVGARLFVAHTQYDYASMLLTRSAQGDHERARELLGVAFATAQELGMTRLEEKIQGLGARDWGLGKETSAPYSFLSIPQLTPEPNSSDPIPDTRPLIPNPQSPAPNLLRQEGDYWTVGYEGSVARLQDAKGLAHLACLLREPQREFHVLDLLAMTDGVPSEGADAGKHETQVLQLHPTTEFSDARAFPDRQAITGLYD